MQENAPTALLWADSVAIVPHAETGRRLIVKVGEGWCVLSARGFDVISRVMACPTEPMLRRASQEVGASPQDVWRTLGWLKSMGMVMAREAPNSTLGEATRHRHTEMACSRTSIWCEPKGVNLLVSHKCNLRCYFCTVPSEEHSGPRFMELHTVRAACDKLIGLPLRSLTVSGGEPLLHPDLLELLRIARAATPRLSLNTNGTLCRDPGLVRELASLLDSVTISLDGHNARTHDPIRGRSSFARTMRALGLFQDTGLCRVSVRAVKTIYMNQREMDRLAASLGVSLHVNGLKAAGRGKEARHRGQAERCSGKLLLPHGFREWFVFRRLESAPDRGEAMKREMVSSLSVRANNGCPGVTDMITVNVDGRVYPCNAATNNSYRGQYVLGSVLAEGGLPDQLTSSAAARPFLSPSVYGSEPCISCFARYFCHAQCPLTRDDRHCEDFRARVKQACWVYSEDETFAGNMDALFGDQESHFQALRTRLEDGGLSNGATRGKMDAANA